ncbi:MAG: tetratricopeptide repeat protein [Bryobacteraceae bacterium]|nr:tetratricopeptide repeat protein [Bryobacteraceae bacterium]
MNSGQKITTVKAYWDELDDDTRNRLRPLIEARFLTTSYDAGERRVIVELSAPQLATQYHLRAFVESSADFLKWREGISARASLWIEAGRPDGLLLNYQDAAEALTFRSGTDFRTDRAANNRDKELTRIELEFIDLSTRRASARTGGEFTRMFAEATVVKAPPELAGSVKEPAAIPVPPPSQAAEAEPVTQPVAQPELARARAAIAVPVPSRARKRSVLYFIAAGLMLLVVIFAGGLLLLTRDSRDPEPDPKPDPRQITTPPQDTPKTSESGGQLATDTTGIDPAAEYNVRARQLLGQSKRDPGKLNLAIEAYTQAIQLGSATTYKERAYAYRLAGNLNKAVEDYLAASKADPEDPKVFASLAYVYSLQKKHVEASGALNEALRLDPSNARYFIDRGNANLAANEKKAALKDFNNALKLDPVSALAVDGRARALRATMSPVGPQDAAPTVYLELASELQKSEAQRIGDGLRALGYNVAPPEIIGTHSGSRELRYHRAEERPIAERLAIELKTLDFPVELRNIEDMADSKLARPRTFRLWFGNVASNAGKGSKE